MPENKPKEVIAAFDFDGTITYHDSLIGFLMSSTTLLRALRNFCLGFPTVIAWAFGISTRQKSKEAMISRFFKGWPIETVRALGKKYALELLPSQVKPEALERLKWHQKQGHRCILISASLDVYLKPWGESQGFDAFITSQLEQTEDGKVTGRLLGANCWGEEKCRRLTDLCGPKENYILYAYGDSQGDKNLLAMADYPFYKKMPSDTL